MKLSDFIKKVLEETNSNTVDFDVAITIEKDEVHVTQDSKIGNMEVTNSRLKFTIKKPKKSYKITYDYSGFPGGITNCSCTPTDHSFVVTSNTSQIWR